MSPLDQLAALQGAKFLCEMNNYASAKIVLLMLAQAGPKAERDLLPFTAPKRAYFEDTLLEAISLCDVGPDEDAIGDIEICIGLLKEVI